MITRKELKLGDVVYHSSRGIGVFSFSCKLMESRNSDITTTFIEFGSEEPGMGEIIKISRYCLIKK